MTDVPIVKTKAELGFVDNPYLTVRKNPVSGTFTINLHDWDSPEIVDGYSVEDTKELIHMLQEGIFYLHKCMEEEMHDNLFEGKEDVKETNTDKVARGPS